MLQASRWFAENRLVSRNSLSHVAGMRDGDVSGVTD